jgi:hypothetical protein
VEEFANFNGEIGFSDSKTVVGGRPGSLSGGQLGIGATETAEPNAAESITKYP